MMSDETMLAVLPETALDFFAQAQGVDALLNAVREKAFELLPAEIDLTTAKGRAEVVSVAHKVARSKTAIDDAGKALVAEYKAIPAKIDATRKRVREELDALKAEVRKPVTEWEEKEAARVQAIRDRIEAIRALSEAKAETAEDIMGWIKTVGALEVDETFEELKPEAALMKDGVLTRLFERHAAAVNREKAEEDRRAKEKADAEAKALEEAEKKVALEKAQNEAALAQAKLAQERAERDAEQAKADAEKKALEAVEAEKKRVADAEAKAKAEEEARIQDAQHRFRIHSEILDDLAAAGLDPNQAALALDAIRDGKVRNLKIEY
jgi:hypothetical protein